MTADALKCSIVQPSLLFYGEVMQRSKMAPKQVTILISENPCMP